MPNDNYAATAGVILGRITQVGLAGLAAILVLGAFFGEMNVLAFAVIGIIALVCLAFVGAIELGVRAIRRRWGATDE